MIVTILCGGVGRAINLPGAMVAALHRGAPVELAGVAYEAVEDPGGDPPAAGEDAAVTEDPPRPRRRRKGG